MEAYENHDLYVKRAYSCFQKTEISKNEPLFVQQFSR